MHYRTIPQLLKLAVYQILPQIGGSLLDKLKEFASILVGTIVGSIWAGYQTSYSSWWNMIVGSIIGLLVSFLIVATIHFVSLSRKNSFIVKTKLEYHELTHIIAQCDLIIKKISAYTVLSAQIDEATDGRFNFKLSAGQLRFFYTG